MNSTFVVRRVRQTIALAFAGIVLSSFGAIANEPNLAEIEAAANKEGRLVWYVAMRSDHIPKVAQLFMKAYPAIKVETMHLLSGDITARVLLEQRGRVFKADFLSASSYATSQMKLEGLIVPFSLPKASTQALTDGAWDPDGYWVGQYALTFPITFNPAKLASQRLPVPKSYEDFAKPEWAGQFGIASFYYDWYQGMTEVLGREKARSMAQRIAANKPVVLTDSTPLIGMLRSGEFAASYNIFGYNSYEDKQSGKSVDFVNVSPVIVSLQTGGIARNAPHPNAAKLFQMFLARRDTQQFISTALGRTSIHKQVEHVKELWDPERVTYHIMNPDRQVKSAREFQQEYSSIFGIGRSKK